MISCIISGAFWLLAPMPARYWRRRFRSRLIAAPAVHSVHLGGLAGVGGEEFGGAIDLDLRERCGDVGFAVQALLDLVDVDFRRLSLAEENYVVAFAVDVVRPRWSRWEDFEEGRDFAFHCCEVASRRAEPIA